MDLPGAAAKPAVAEDASRDKEAASRRAQHKWRFRRLQAAERANSSVSPCSRKLLSGTGIRQKAPPPCSGGDAFTQLTVTLPRAMTAAVPVEPEAFRVMYTAET